MNVNGDINNDADDDYDVMLDLFSFGADTAIPLEQTDQPSTNNEPSSNPPRKDCVDVIGRSSIAILSAKFDDDDNNSYASNDSFIELLENAQQNEISMTEDMSSILMTGNKDSIEKCTANYKNDDSDMQEILDWLDDDDEKGNELLQRQEEELNCVPPPRLPSLKEPISQPGSISKSIECVEFDTLEFAVMSKGSSRSQIRRLLEKENFAVSPEIRPHLWSKIICEKTLEEILQSSLADSFQRWEQDHWQRLAFDEKNSVSNEITLQWKQEYFQTDKVSNEDEKEENEPSPDHHVEKEDQISSKISPTQKKEQQSKWLEKHSDYLARRILTVIEDGDFQFYRKALQAILRNYFNTGSAIIKSNFNEDDSYSKDSLIPPVLCTILSSGVPPPVACVMLSQIIPSFMPILALTTKERQEAATILHRQFYLLAWYHLPLLVLHLDKFMPGWQNCYPHGKIPQSWLISYFAGEIDGTFMNAKRLLYLWDLILTNEDNCIRFFLALAILDFHAERLHLLTNDDLKKEFSRVLSLSWSSNSHYADNAGVSLSEEKANNLEAIDLIQEWNKKATLLREETPLSVIRDLKVQEDEAVTNTLVARQETKEKKLRLQQQAEERAIQEAREAEKELKADEARTRLTRARLVAFYRQYNPGKENNIDKIMKSYEGRYEVLDAKLKLKYGAGFNPVLKPKPITITKNNSKLFSSMNSGFGQLKSMSKNKKHQNVNIQPEKIENTVVQVPVSEVLPGICWSRDTNTSKLSRLNESSKLVKGRNGRIPLKFHIIDCRLDAATKEQGKLPTSILFRSGSQSDSKRMEEQEIFESLRGSVHICIMSEGYAALPQLYGHKMTSGLADTIKEEEERTDACARFFRSKGFPFVSLMEGGFASAHAYLCREGPKHNLNVNDILIEYDPEVSLFGRLEKLHSMSSRDKAQRSLHNLFDSSMTALTKRSIRLESLTSDFDSGITDELMHQKGGPKNAVQRFFGGKIEGSAEDKKSCSFDKFEIRPDRKQRQTHGSLRDTFARKIQTMRDGNNNSFRESSSESLTNNTSTEIDSRKLSSSSSSYDPSRSKPEEKMPIEEPTNNSQGQHQHSRLSSLGSQLKKMQDTPASPTKGPVVRRPFTRFGGLGIGQNTKRDEAHAVPEKANNFAGSLKKFQINTIARMRAADGASDESQDTDKTEATKADSIFPRSSPVSRIRKKEEECTNSFKSQIISKV